MKISYLVTCHNEENSLKNLLSRLNDYLEESDEIIVIDDFSDNPKTKEILKEYGQYAARLQIVQHALDNNYGAHKNYGNSLCKGDWIFQLDGDELPSIALICNIKDVIDINPGVELIFVPRINDFIGVTEEHAKRWGWRLTPCKEYNNRPVVNWPDYQGRVYKNAPNRIQWDRRLHEKIEGHGQYATLPPEVDWAIYHDKTIETQIATNLRYNKAFTEKENQGHDVFSKKK